MTGQFSRFLHHGLYPGTDPLPHYRDGLQNQDVCPVVLLTQPDRGPGSDMTGRSLATMQSMPVDLQPYGWRLSRTSGIDHRRIDAALQRDIASLGDAMEEQNISSLQTIKAQTHGPISLAAEVHLPNGEKVVQDSGATRELAVEQANGLLEHLQQLATEYSLTKVTVEVFEASAGSVLAGTVPTASGFERYRAVDLAVIREYWQQLISTLKSEDGLEVEIVLNLARSSDWQHKRSMVPRTPATKGWLYNADTMDHFSQLVGLATEAEFDAFYVPPGLSPRHWELLAEWVESEKRLMLGADTAKPVNEHLEQLLQPWKQQGLPNNRLIQLDVAPLAETQRLNMEAHRQTLTKGAEFADALNQRARS